MEEYAKIADPWFTQIIRKQSFDVIPFMPPSYHSTLEDKDFTRATGLSVDAGRRRGWKIAKAMIEGEFSKAQTSGSPTYVAGNLPVLIPVWLQPEFVDVTRKEHPLLDRIRKVPVRGIIFNFNEITAYGITGQGYLAEAPAFSAAEHTFTRRTHTQKFCYQMAELTGPYIAGSEGFVDGLTLQTGIHRDAILDTIENGLLNGDNTGNNPNGLRTQQGTTNQTDKAGAAFNIKDLRDTLRLAFDDNGNPSVGVCDGANFDAIKALIEGDLRYTPDAYEITWGIRTLAFEGVPIIRSRHMPAGANDKDILFLDERVILMAELQPVVFEQLARTKDTTPFQYKAYHQFVNQAVPFNSILSNAP